MMILLNPATGLAVNPQEISSMLIERCEGTRGSASRLAIKMKSGYELQIRHCPDAGIDVEQLHQQLLEAA